MAYQNINQYNFRRFGLKPVNEVTDLCLASDEKDYDQEVIFSPFLIGEDDGNRMPFKFDFNSSGTTLCQNSPCVFSSDTIVSENYWNPADTDPNFCPITTELCDVGLTGIDNGLVQSMSGETIEITTGLYTNLTDKFSRYKYDRRMKLHPITGFTTTQNRLWNDNSYTYNLSYTNAGGDIGYVANLQGGFFQGFYKLAGYDYQVFPERVSLGWTTEFLLKYRWTGNTDVGLNYRYPDNKGTFFYMGARAENKFYHYADGHPKQDSGYTRVTSGLTCMHTCGCASSANTSSECLQVYQPSGGTITTCLCGCPCECDTKAQYPEKDPLYDEVSNALSLRLSGDTGSPRLCVKTYRITGGCESTGTCLTGITYVTGTSVTEWCSTRGIFDDCSGTTYANIEHWVQIDTVFERYEWLDTCDLYDKGGLGLLVKDVYFATLEGRSVSLIEPPITREQPYDPASTEVVTFTDMWTEEQKYRLGTLKFYVNGKLFMVAENFEEIIPRLLNVEKEKQIGVGYNISIGGGTQGLHDNLTFSGGCPTNLSGLSYQQDPECLTTYDLNNTIYSGLTTHIRLEELFGGSMIGDISAFRMYTEPLNAAQIKHNFKILKDKYDLLNPDCPNCRIPIPVTPTTTPTNTTTPSPTNTQTPTTTPTPTIGTITIELVGEYSPGSINANYIAIANSTLNGDLEIMFVDVLGTLTGSSITISGSVMINSGQTTGNSYYTISDDYTNLSEVNTFTSVTTSYTGVTLNTFVINTSSQFDVTPTPTPTITPTITPTNTETPTNTPTNTTTNTPTVTPTNTPTVTPTQGASPTPTQTPTETPTQTPTETPTETPTNTPTETPTNTPTNTPTETPTETPGLSPSETPTETPTPTVTSTPSSTPSLLINPIIVGLNEYLEVGLDEYLMFVDPVVSPTPTPTVTTTNTETPTPTNTETPTETPTPTNTETPTETPTPTNTETPTNTPTNTETPTPTNTETPTNTPTPSSTPSIVTSGLIIQLDAYENSSYPGSGTTVVNMRTPGTYDHTLNGATFTTLNTIKCFDTTTGTQRVVVNGTGPTLPTTGYTYISWARLEPGNPASFRTLLYTNSPKYTPITIPNNSNTLGYWDSAFRSSGYDLSGQTDVWVQYAVVGTNSSQKFYINGSEVGSPIAFGAGGTTHWGWGNNDAAGQPWGYVANMYFYNRQLSLSEIQQQYSFLAPRFIEPTPTPTSTSTPTVTPTNTLTSTNTQTPTNTSTNTETPTQTVTPTNTQTPTTTISQTPTNTPTPSTTPIPVTGYGYNLIALPYNFPTSGNSIMNAATGQTGTTLINQLSITSRGFYFNSIDSIGVDRTSHYLQFTGQSVTVTFTQNGDSAIYSGDSQSFKFWSANTGTPPGVPGTGFVFGTNIGVPPSNTPSGVAVLIQSATTTWVTGATVYVSVEINPTTTPTVTPTNTVTPTVTTTNTNTPTVTPTNTTTPTSTVTPTNTNTPTVTSAIVTSNLNLYYDPSNPSSYSGSGTVLNDLSGNGLTGTLSNVTYTSPAFNFNGTNSTISVPDNALLEPGSGDWTMEVWVNQSVISGSSRIILAKTDGGNSNQWGYGLRTIANGNTYGEVGNGTISITTNSSTLNINTWYQVVAVWTNVATNNFELFINGVSQGSQSHSFTSIRNTTNPLYIGSFNNGQFSQWLNGKVGVVRLYSSALTSSQVTQNFNADKSKYGL